MKIYHAKIWHKAETVFRNEEFIDVNTYISEEKKHKINDPTFHQNK